MTKREKKRIEQRRRQSLREKEAEIYRNALIERQDTLRKARIALENDEEYSRHAAIFELLTELIDMNVDEINQCIKSHGVENTYLNDYNNKLKQITSEQVKKQDDHFLDKSEDNFEEFADKCNFIYEILPFISKIKKENRIKAISTIKIMAK